MPEFLFIDYQDDNSQNRVLQKTKRGFARKARYREDRLAAIERLKSSTPILRHRLPVAYVPRDPERAEPDQIRDCNAEDLVADAGPSDTETSESQRIIPTVNFGSPRRLSGDGFVDPFSTTAIPMTGFMNSFFHHLRHFTIPGAYPLNDSPMMVWWWQQGISQPVIQLSLLVSAASHQIAMNTLHNRPSKNSQQSVKEYLRLRGNMIRILNGLLRDPVAAKSAVLIVASLRSVEAIACRVEAAKTHTKGLETLIELNGGLEALDHLVQSKIYHGDILLAALTDSYPTLSPTEKWRSEILDEVKIFHSTSKIITGLEYRSQKDLSRLSCLGTSFFASPWYRELKCSLKDFIQRSQRLLQYYAVARLQSAIATVTDNDLFLLLEHQLMSIRYTPELSASFNISDLLNEPLRVTLIIYLNACVWHWVFPIMRHFIWPLQRSLLSVVIAKIPTLNHIKRTAPDVLFWMLFIGGMGSRGHPERSWFVAQLVDLTCHLGIRDWDAAQEILRGFFYVDHPGQLGGEELWEEVVYSQRSESLTLDSATHSVHSSQRVIPWNPQRPDSKSGRVTT